MRQIFLSYSRADKEQARKLYNDLKKSPDIHVWFDEQDLLPGIRWEPAITKAIRESRYFIALMSKDSVETAGFRNTELSRALKELDRFPEDEIFLIPTRLDECEPPFEKLKELNYADLFPDWNYGVERMRKAMRISSPENGGRKSKATPSRKKAARKKTVDESATQRPTSKSKRRVKPISEYHYRVGLVDLSKTPQLRPIARKLNRLQSFCHFSVSKLVPTKASLRKVNGIDHLDLNLLNQSFYKEIAPLKLDHIICMTDRLIRFEDEDHVYSNYLGKRSIKDGRVFFTSTHRLEEQAEDAEVSYSFALVYGIVSVITNYFLDIDFHKTIRSCPMDFTEEHDDIIKGLKKKSFCRSCLKRLSKNQFLNDAVVAMLESEQNLAN